MDYLSVQLIPLEKGRKYAVEAQVKANVSKDTIKGSIKVHTNNSDQPIIEIPVHGLVKD